MLCSLYSILLYSESIRIDEVAAALKKMKKHKAPGLSGLVAEMIQTTGDIGIQWILDLCNGIVKEGCIPEDWKSSVVLPIYKGQEAQLNARGGRPYCPQSHKYNHVVRI